MFPSYMSITSDNASSELEEERRLAYVGITRAMKELVITSARQRMVRGETQYNKVSRFVKEIPPELLNGEIKKPAYLENRERRRYGRSGRRCGISCPVRACRRERFHRYIRKAEA